MKRVLLTGADLTIANTDGNTALHLGARTGDLAIMQSLLEHGAPLDACSPEHSHTPLMTTVFGFHLRDRVNMQRITEVLIAANANLNAVDHVGGVHLFKQSEPYHIMIYITGANITPPGV